MPDKQRVLFLVTRVLCSHVLDTVLYNYYCLYGGCQRKEEFEFQVLCWLFILKSLDLFSDLTTLNVRDSC